MTKRNIIDTIEQLNKLVSSDKHHEPEIIYSDESDCSLAEDYGYELGDDDGYYEWLEEQD